ncbi:hypothetical protein AB4562_01885 [Vibrio sp. 10N.222.54.A1]|uniref:hypothetical protein n=1 Tax=unclassified Vibrio TaxID=2614977 RepID=UPI00354E4F9A
MTKSWILVLVSISLSVAGAEPIVLQGRGCVDASGNEYADRLLAKSLAKGQLAHELGSVVSADTILKTKTIESNSSIETIDTLTETVSMESKHYISRVTTITQGYEQINGDLHYCVHLKQER